MSRIIMHRGDIGLELVKQERSAHQLSSSDLIGCGSSSSAMADGRHFEISAHWLSLVFNCSGHILSFRLIFTDHLDDDLDHDDDDGVDVINHHHQNVINSFQSKSIQVLGRPC